MLKRLIVIPIIVLLFPLSWSFANVQITAEGQKKKPIRDQNGLRTTLQERGIRLDAIYTCDLFKNLRGGIQRRSEYLGVVDLMLTINLEPLIHWKNATLSTDFVGIHGGNPSEHVGDFQGISNITAPNTWKIYEAWFQQNLWTDKLSILIGIYDVNSEFDVIETAGLFLNSSHGMGPEFSQSGKNGDPTFPYPDLALRVKMKLVENIYFQAAVLDGVPGDPENPKRTRFRIKKEDGALLTSEIIFITGEEKFKYLPPISKRKQRRRHRIGFDAFRKIFRGSGRRYRTPIIEIPQQNYSKIAVGGWYYTSDFTDLFEYDENGNPKQHKGSWGMYALGERVLLSKKDDPAKALSLFLRVGISDKSVNRVNCYFGSGILYSGISPSHYNDQLGFAVAAAHNSDKFKKTMLNQGEIYDDWEVVLESSYRVQIKNWLYMQPDVQYIINPGYDSSLKNAMIIGTRIEVSY